jgi:flavorubredoxin
LRTDIVEFINRYRRWSAEIPVNNPKRLLIYYISAHGNTATMAEEIAKGARESGIEVQLYDIGEINIHEHLDRIETCDGMLVGSPTINNDAVKPAWDLLSSLAHSRCQRKNQRQFRLHGLERGSDQVSRSTPELI